MKQRKVGDRGRVSIPKFMLDGIGAKTGDSVNINYDNKQIIITYPETEPQRARTQLEVKQKLNNLKQLINEGFEDDRLLGSIDMLNWFLSTERDISDVLNDYSDKTEEEDLSISKDGD